MKSPKFLISGGGTGGHIFPAIAIADELRKRLPDAEILFVGAQDKMEMEKVPQAGYNIEGLWISGISRTSIFSNFKFPFKIISSLLKSRKIINKFKPDAAIGTGGFASGPALYAASRAGIPTFIQEQNSFPGITNKKLAAKASAIYVAYEGMNQYFPESKVKLTGNPVRTSLFTDIPDTQEAKKILGLNPGNLTILSVGGSLGSRTMNKFWKENAIHFAEQNIQIIWQTGKLDFPTLSKDSSLKNKNIHINEFIKDMSNAYAAADIIISRAGAIAISELCLAGKPTILIPFPYAAEDHQTKNAEQLVSKNAAIMVKDQEVPVVLSEKIQNLIDDKNIREQLSIEILKLGKPHAVKDIVSDILKKLKFDN
ncbi:undecaprenyldiphospho-muramoylpentapeptide beta-N-acetylglucosaminyltransferase [Apibacter sp. HY039]|uniref:undecaprenyldiphospho-muramoylpentapeptide beta-N-acetylglucosaminyltransferase n=1 Tax=Apibacter sp. HY039 TaxID=2501476 RepID=UPI000FEB6493|nr:undecaprenyldiphospho-muramoylpentapeptide beta-N-acetylglucosaminyltransferase [Apibacter sp. HY039]